MLSGTAATHRFKSCVSKLSMSAGSALRRVSKLGNQGGRHQQHWRIGTTKFGAPIELGTVAKHSAGDPAFAIQARRRRQSWQPEERLSKPATGDEGSPLRYTLRAAKLPLQSQHFWATEELQFAGRRAAFHERVLEVLMAVTHPERNIGGASSLAPGRRGALASYLAAFAHG